MEFRGIMGGFYRISEWIMRLSVINVLWVICAIPFFLFGLMLLQSQTSDQLVQTLFLMALVSPFTIFPSTAAMFTVTRKWLTGDEDAPLFKTFFRGYKENFLQSMLGGFIYMLIGVILYTNFRFYGNQTGIFGVLRFLVLSLTVILSISMFHFFSILTHLHMKLLQIVKNSLLITIGNPVRSLSMIVLNTVIMYVSFTMFTFLIPFFMGSLIAIVSFWHFNLIFGKLQEKQQELAANETEKAESLQQDPEEKQDGQGEESKR
ncbi:MULTISPECIES: DUF624 domain-containing protein [unclassified Paenibacillus]|uniref:YesL family protein n=1 Tax=unclassified Paenibacillus TaxID=185978 RepID=UPI001AE41771|nr:MULTISPECIES: DUF624 domain-containing protein [unclassified Paenibacillus]MBP1154766.1 putative membrane protein YesL [Paenibacillus sp. PvP091]MBP1169850.1 putative membrane protein YesL [Paenibacillus sp. PvR098]MBP2440878.1 putative membrane protein YesL [Paenibacillus sp. PvP052]